MMTGERPHPSPLSVDREGAVQGNDHTPNPLSVDREGAGEEHPSASWREVRWHTPAELWVKLKPLARQMRMAPTEAEALLWQRLRDRQLLGFKFRRQHSIERFIVDFYCAQADLVIEVDGPVHQYQQEEDLVRQAYIESRGFRLLRFTNDEVLHSLDRVLGHIAAALAPPSPPAERGPGGEVHTAR